MSSTTIHADAIIRCRDAFADNKIPWDEALERLPAAKLLETARYWEAKANQRPIVEDEEESIRDAVQVRSKITKRLSLLAGFAPPGTRGSGGLTDRQAIKQRQMFSDN